MIYIVYHSKLNLKLCDYALIQGIFIFTVSFQYFIIVLIILYLFSYALLRKSNNNCKMSGGNIMIDNFSLLRQLHCY